MCELYCLHISVGLETGFVCLSSHKRNQRPIFIISSWATIEIPFSHICRGFEGVDKAEGVEFKQTGISVRGQLSRDGCKLVQVSLQQRCKLW